MNEFIKLGITENIIKALSEAGFTSPTEIQAKAIPTLIANEKVDFHGQAQTGTGKTLAFGIPLLQKIDLQDKSVQALVIAPTRELVLQIVESLSFAAKFYDNLKIAPIYGGVDIERQIRQLKKGIHIVVGTPGRLNDHIRRRNLKLNNLKTLVLDEADIMLDMGFKEEIDFILSKSCKNRSIWLFSATTKSGIDEIKRTHMKDVESVRIAKKNVTASNTEQFSCVVPMRYRQKVLCRVIDTSPSFYGIIFCQTKLLTADVAARLSKRGYSAGALHGDMDQKMRNKVIKKFKDKEFDILVATDVAARGIDVNSLTHVINYSLPEDQESYIHRVGRTGRAGNKGTAITFVNSREVRRMKSMARRFSADIKPFDIPSLQDILKSRVSKALSYSNENCEKDTQLNGALDPLRSSISDLPKDKLVNIAVNLLSDKFLKSYSNEQEIPANALLEDSGGRSGFRSRGRSSFRDRSSGGRHFGDRRFRDRGNNGNVSEIVLHVGSEHGINRSDIVKYFVNSRAIDRKHIEKVRVIKRRSFVMVPSGVARKVVSALNGKKFQNKKIRVGITDR